MSLALCFAWKQLQEKRLFDAYFILVRTIRRMFHRLNVVPGTQERIEVPGTKRRARARLPALWFIPKLSFEEFPS